VIGYVGDTGDASECHLHFELWDAPGWYEGGRPVDPLALLKRWDR
jgi:murein DD-endopeptidase MepM/ murein hydrolase activator NlpD